MSLFDSPIGGPFQGPQDDAHYLGPRQRITGTMRCFRDDEEVDYLVVCVGSAGGGLIQRPARAGFKVIGVEAGKFWHTERDWVSDEAGSHGSYWEDPRVIGGTDPLSLGANNCGKGVAAARCIGRRLPRVSTRRISRCTPATGSAQTGRSPIGT